MTWPNEKLKKDETDRNINTEIAYKIMIGHSKFNFDLVTLSFL